MRTLLTSILLASACAAPAVLVMAQPAPKPAPTSASTPSDPEIKLAQQKLLADLKAKADRGDQEAAAWYLYSTMIFASNLDEARVEKAKLQALADSGNLHAQQFLKHHETRKSGLLPNSTIEQKLAGASSAWKLQDSNSAYFLLSAVKDDKNVSAAQLIEMAKILKDWGQIKSAIYTLETPNAVNDPAAMFFRGYYLMKRDDDPNNDAAADALIRRAAAAGDRDSLDIVAYMDTQAADAAKASATLLAEAEKGLYPANMELARAYYSGNMPGIPKDIEKAKKHAEYVTRAQYEYKNKNKDLWDSHILLGEIAESQGDTKAAYDAYNSVENGYNLNIDIRRIARSRLDIMKNNYREAVNNARFYSKGANKNTVNFNSYIEKALKLYSEDGFSEPRFMLGEVAESKKDYDGAYQHYLAAFMDRDTGYESEALTRMIQLEKNHVSKLKWTEISSVSLREARREAGLPDWSDYDVRLAYYFGTSTSSSTASNVQSSGGMPSEVRQAIAAFNRELDQFQQRNNLAGELHNTASNEIGKINESEWGTQTAAGSRVCNMFKTAIALRKTSIYYLNRAYNEAERIPSRFPQRAEALKEYEVGKSDIETADGITNKFGNQMGCWSGDYTGNGDPFYRNGL